MNAIPIKSVAANDGFTLIEVLMAMLIMTVGLFGLLQSVSIAYQHKLKNKLREQAVAVAEEQLNTMRLHAVLAPTTTVTQYIGGVGTKYAVTRNSKLIGGESNRLKVAVTWSFKNISTTHEIFTIKKM